MTTESGPRDSSVTGTRLAGGAPESSPRPRVVVLGGGVAGLTAAHELRRRLGDRAAITLISASERFLLGLGLLWVPFGRKTTALSFPIAKTLERRGTPGPERGGLT